jgi:hypothetical protein
MLIIAAKDRTRDREPIGNPTHSSSHEQCATGARARHLLRDLRSAWRDCAAHEQRAALTTHDVALRGPSEAFARMRLPVDETVITCLGKQRLTPGSRAELLRA